MAPRKRLGYWLSERKAKKLALEDILEELGALNIETVKINLNLPLRDQGPFDIILHKLTDLVTRADLGNKDAGVLVSNFESYLHENPHVIVIDPIDCLRVVIDRFKTYNIIQELVSDEDVFVPPFVVLKSNNLVENIEVVRNSQASFPLVCKPIVAHGSSSAHEVGVPLNCNLHVMTLVFNEKGLSECCFPCVVQSFVNHNAVLYKLFALGDKYVLVERPSIKNLTASEDTKPIHFHSGDITKTSSCSQLTFQENRHVLSENRIPCQQTLDRIVHKIRKILRLGLFGVDVVVDESSGRHAIIDVNSFPGYDGLENFPGKLAAFIRYELDKNDEIKYQHGHDVTCSNSSLINQRS